MTTVRRGSAHAGLFGAGTAVSRLAGGVGLVGPLSAVSLVRFFAVGGPFGALNDIGNACWAFSRARSPSPVGDRTCPREPWRRPQPWAAPA